MTWVRVQSMTDTKIIDWTESIKSSIDEVKSWLGGGHVHEASHI